VMYGFNYGDRFYFYQHGYDEQFSSLSVGLVLMALTIRDGHHRWRARVRPAVGEPSRTSRSGRTRRDCLQRVDLFPPPSQRSASPSCGRGAPRHRSDRAPSSLPHGPQEPLVLPERRKALAHAGQERAGHNHLPHARARGSPRRWRVDRSGR
jgi:hypothetical protein